MGDSKAMSDLPGSPNAKHLAVDLVTATQHIIVSGLQEIPDLKTCRPDHLQRVVRVLTDGDDLVVALNDTRSTGPSLGIWNNTGSDYSGYMSSVQYNILSRIPGMSPRLAQCIIDAISQYHEEYDADAEATLQEIFNKLQSEILPQLKTIKEFWVKALCHSIQAGIQLFTDMPPASSAILYEIDDIVTAIEHVIVTTLEDLGPEGITRLDNSDLNSCRALLQWCVEAKITLDRSNWSVPTPPEQGMKWQGYDGAKDINRDLMKVQMSDWLRRALVTSTVFSKVSDVDTELSRQISAGLYDRLSRLGAVLKKNITSVPRSYDTTVLRASIDGIINRIERFRLVVYLEACLHLLRLVSMIS